MDTLHETLFYLTVLKSVFQTKTHTVIKPIASVLRNRNLTSNRNNLNIKL